MIAMTLFFESSQAIVVYNLQVSLFKDKSSRRKYNVKVCVSGQCLILQLSTCIDIE